nr:centrosomal protein of 135 kDa-like [Rhipicephalus microplus]
MGPKYEALRSDLTEMGYTEAFSLESAPLVARLWSDLCSYQEQCVDANTALRRTVQESQEKDDLAERYRQENAKALAEVNRLHACVVQLKEKHNDKLNDLENRLHEAEQCKKKFEFVKADCINKIKHLEKELQLKSDKILQLQSALSTQAVVHVTDTAKVPASYRTQGIELTSLLPRQQGVAGRKAGPPAATRDAQEIDIIRMADTRIHQLQHERRDLKESLYQSRVSVDLLQQRIEARNAEIERLTRTLREGLPHTALQDGCSCGRNLQPQGKEDGTAVPTEQHSNEPKKPASGKQPLKQVRKVNFGHLHRKTDPRARDPKPAKSKRPTSVPRQADQQSKGLTLEEQIQALEEEKQRLKERVKQLASSERQLLLEIQGLLANKGQTADPDSSEELRALERERDHYKDELMRLHQVLKMGNTRRKLPSSSGSESGKQADPKNLETSNPSAEDEQLLSRLGLLQREVDKLTATVENLSKQRDQLLVERDSHARQLAILAEKLKEKDKDTQTAHFTCRATESHVDKLQDDLNSKDSDIVKLTCRVRELEAEAASAAESHSRLLQENQRLHENVTLVAKEHKNMAADFENAVQQRRDLELQIQEYVIKVAKIEELLRTRDQEREDLLDQYRSLISANADLRTQAEQSQREHDSSDATLNSLRQQLARHMSVTSEQERKLASLGATVAALEESLQHSAAEGSRLKEELQKSSDTRARLAEQVESLQDQLAKEQTVNNQISGHLRRLEDDLSLARTEAATARSDATSLERLLATSREQRCQTDIALERLSAEMEKMKQDMQAGVASRAAQNEENNFLRSKLSEFEHAVEQLKQQVINEQYEREKCKEELNRLHQQARSGLNGKLTLHGFTGSFQTRLNFSPENGTRPPQ